MKATHVSIVLLCSFFFLVVKGLAQQVVSITDFGIGPNQSVNALPAIKKALKFCQHKQGIIIDFPTGRYDFWPVTQAGNTEQIGFDMQQLKGITVEGNNSSFIFHGKMQIARIDSSSNIAFKGFSVDWDRPFISQAVITATTDSTLDVRIDRRNYPYTIERDTIFFYGEDWKLPVLNVYNNLYDKARKEIVYHTWDNPLGDIFTQKAEELPNGNVRFHGQVKIKPDSGTFVSLFHLRYAIVGFEIKNSTEVLLKDLCIYHALSHGVLGIRSENITMDNASMMVNDTKGRVFSIIADASHFINCKGTIKVENCAHTGQGDDFINVHGTNAKILAIVDKHTVLLNERGGYNGVGDEVWLVDSGTAQRTDSLQIAAIKAVYDQEKLRGYEVTFNEKLPSTVNTNDFIENKTWTARLELRNCRILKRHRARGILVTTPQEAIIENNYFRTAGTAILIEGDLDFWFESGAHRNLLIRNNVFEDCLTSGNAHGNRGEWGEAVITITPSHKPSSVHDVPYHQHIRILHNTFKVFDAPLIRARSVDGLWFTDNTIIKTFTYQPYTWQKSACLLDGCRKVIIKNNLIDDQYQTRDVLIEHMQKSDVNIDQKQGFVLRELKGLNTHHTW
ncbi:right-handed parallel beta-helix repeat-containing protein [Olivibacter ginsenosidimutans]|uniref:Right-handed parallel beta-helix repeat-containing protein n=1 Tax=Olivibacter ginsenosidimutans TaxID=1176537 RepID=A0ABP9CF23_9SPHI